MTASFASVNLTTAMGKRQNGLFSFLYNGKVRSTEGHKTIFPPGCGFHG